MAKKFSKASGKASPKMTLALNKIVTVVSKVLEVAHWVGVVGAILLAIFGFTGGKFLGASGDVAAGLEGLNVYGFEAAVTDGSTVNYMALGWFSVGAVIIMALMAMVFRNIYLIAKSSRENTPFTEDNMRMVKELGIFFIAVPVVGVIFEIILELATGVEANVNCDGVVMGLIMLYLTQIFARGVNLEDDVKGLV